MVNPALGQARFEPIGPRRCSASRGHAAESDFDGALANLGHRAVNRSIPCITRVASDPAASIECMWFLTGTPATCWRCPSPSSTVIPSQIWVFYDESRSQQAGESPGIRPWSAARVGG